MRFALQRDAFAMRVSQLPQFAIVAPVKRRFLTGVIKELSLKAEVLGDIKDEVIDSEIIICRAFKKLDQIIQVSREIAKKAT